MFGWHISFEYLYFKSRRREWMVRVWKDVNVKAYQAAQRAKKKSEEKMNELVIKELMQ